VVPRLAPSVVAALLVATCLLPAAATGSARGAKADLEVTAGEVSGSRARVTGSFTVRNTGAKRAPATRSALKVDGRRVRTIDTRALRPGRHRVVSFRIRLGGGTHVVSVCADAGDAVRERRERNNCRRLGTVRLTSTTVPSDPVDYDAGTVFKIGTSPSEYWMYVPTAYDDTHRTPTRLVVFAHGCGGTAKEYADIIKDQVAGIDHLVMTPGLGKDGQCWDPPADAAPLLASIADVKKHFNVDPKRVVLGGYSSGSTLAGKVAFAHAASFAGLVMLPGRPWWSNAERAELIAGADWKLNIAWRPHTGDEYYDIAELRADRRALNDAGFPLSFSEVAGDHAFTAADLGYVFGKLGGWSAP
jgi:dienelactone hydrolase